MESRHPLDTLIAAADRALRAVFAPAHASRPVPGDPPAAANAAAGAANATGHTSTPPSPADAAGYTSASSSTANAAGHVGAAESTTTTAAGHTAAAAEPTDVCVALTEAQRRESAALMRVNHAGEVAAQALYHGQALVSRSPATREVLLKAANEETDHLAWC